MDEITKTAMMSWSTHPANASKRWSSNEEYNSAAMVWLKDEIRRERSKAVPDIGCIDHLEHALTKYRNS